MQSPRLVALVALLLAACVVTDSGPVEGAPGLEGPPLLARLPEELRPTLQVAMGAMADGSDELASGALARLRALGAEGDLLDWVRSAELVLEGRRLVRGLDLELAIRPRGDEEGGAAVLGLAIRNHHDIPLRLQFSPPVLTCERSWIDPAGRGGRSSESAGVDVLGAVDLPPSGSAFVEVALPPPARGVAAAVRERWRLEAHFCQISSGGVDYPVNAPPVAATERYLLAERLRLGWLGPEPLVELVLRAESPRPEQVVERAVRIPPDRWDEALDALTEPLLAATPRRTMELLPALVWLSRAGDTSPGLEAYASDPSRVRIAQGGQLVDTSLLGDDPGAWKMWLVARGQLSVATPRGALDLPGAMREDALP